MSRNEVLAEQLRAELITQQAASNEKTAELNRVVRLVSTPQQVPTDEFDAAFEAHKRAKDRLQQTRALLDAYARGEDIVMAKLSQD